MLHRKFSWLSLFNTVPVLLFTWEERSLWTGGLGSRQARFISLMYYHIFKKQNREPVSLKDCGKRKKENVWTTFYDAFTCLNKKILDCFLYFFIKGAESDTRKISILFQVYNWIVILDVLKHQNSALAHIAAAFSMIRYCLSFFKAFGDSFQAHTARY